MTQPDECQSSETWSSWPILTGEDDGARSYAATAWVVKGKALWSMGRACGRAGLNSENLVAGREDVCRVKVLLSTAQPCPGRPEVLAPVVTGHRESADRIQGAAGGTNPLVDCPVGLYKPVDFGDSVRCGNPHQVERVKQIVCRQPQQRAGGRRSAESGERDLAVGSQVRRRQPIQFATDHGLDVGVTDECHEPQVGVEPLAVGSQKLLQCGESVETVEIL